MLLIGVGFVAARRGIIQPQGAKDLSNLCFLVLTPALLFRTMSAVHLAELDFRPVAGYFAGVLILFFATLAINGLSRRSAVLALACTFSNTVMIGIPLISLAYGDAGLVLLLTLVSVHALILLTLSTLVLELAVTRETLHNNPAVVSTPAETGKKSVGLLLQGAHLALVFTAARQAVFHPVPLPILAGLLFGLTGLNLPAVVDKPLQWLGSAFAPLALLLVGVTLASKTARAQWNTALLLACAKNVALPVLVALIGYFWGVTGLPLTVMVVAASLPIGANVFLFSQRYAVAEGEVTAAVAISTVLAMGSISMAMHWYPA